MPKRDKHPDSYGSKKLEQSGENSKALTRQEEIVILRHCIEFRSLITADSKRLFYQAVAQAFTESQCLPYIYSATSLECFVGFNVRKRRESCRKSRAQYEDSTQIEELLDQLISHIDQVERAGAMAHSRETGSSRRPRSMRFKFSIENGC